VLAVWPASAKRRKLLHEVRKALGPTTYAVRSKGDLAWVGGLFLFVGSVFVGMLSLWILGLLTVNGKSQATLGDYPSAGIGLAMGAGFCYVGLRHLLRLAHTVTVEDTGELVLSNVVGNTRLAVEDIHSIRDGTALVGVEGSDARELQVHHAGACASSRTSPAPGG
jgi:hypothetical protein